MEQGKLGNTKMGGASTMLLGTAGGPSLALLAGGGLLGMVGMLYGSGLLGEEPPVAETLRERVLRRGFQGAHKACAHALEWHEAIESLAPYTTIKSDVPMLVAAGFYAAELMLHEAYTESRRRTKLRAREDEEREDREAIRREKQLREHLKRVGAT